MLRACDGPVTPLWTGMGSTASQPRRWPRSARRFVLNAPGITDSSAAGWESETGGSSGGRRQAITGRAGILAGAEGLEPPTFGFGDRRSSQLSYAPGHSCEFRSGARQIPAAPSRPRTGVWGSYSCGRSKPASQVRRPRQYDPQILMIPRRRVRTQFPAASSDTGLWPNPAGSRPRLPAPGRNCERELLI